MKSELSSANRACRATAASRFSAGRSRGSWTESPAAITRTSSRQSRRAGLEDHPPEPAGRAASWASLRPMALRRRAARCRPCRRHDGLPGERSGARTRPALPAGRCRRPCSPVRRFHKREILDIAQPDGRHLKDDRRQVRPQYLRLGKGPPGHEVLLRVKPHAYPGPRRPQRPALWLADAWDIRSMGSRCTLVRRP